MINTPSTTDSLAFFNNHTHEIQRRLSDLLQSSSTSYGRLPAEEQQQLSERITAALGEMLAQQRPAAIQQLLSAQPGDHQPADMLAALDLVRRSVIGALKSAAANDPAGVAELFEPVSDALHQLTSAGTAGLLYESTAEAQHLRRVNQLMRELHELRDFADLVATIVRYAEPFDATRVLLYTAEYDAQGQTIWPIHPSSWERNGSALSADQRAALPNIRLAELITQHTGVYVEDAQRTPSADSETRRLLAGLNIGAFFVAPILLSGRTVGAFAINWPEPRAFSPQERDILDTIVFHAPFLAQRLLLISELQTHVGEQSLLRADLEMQADELRRFKMLIDNALDGIAVMDPELRLLYANPSFLELTGWDESALGRATHDSFDPAERQRLADEVLPEVLRDGDWQGDIAMQRPDGAAWTASVSAFLISDEQGGAKGISWFFRDISDQLRDEQERLQLQEEVIAIQQAALRELSSPIIPLTEDVLVMPLIGSIDSQRAQQIIEGLLEGVMTYHASTAILDITGVPVVDTQIANALLRAASAVKLLGARMVITGIRPEVAQTLVGLGVGMGEIVTYGTLQAGIASVLRKKEEGRRKK
ncbi:MAG TPA: STAS domain-containing protein [Roseiflexaceae bacterium]|nr:STAS domain-containing protein [Roseiflexaceae bacterium]